MEAPGARKPGVARPSHFRNTMKQTVNQKLAAAARAYREGKKFTQADMARHCKVPYRTYVRVEEDTAGQIKVPVAVAICAGIGKTVSEVIGA